MQTKEDLERGTSRHCQKSKPHEFYVLKADLMIEYKESPDLLKLWKEKPLLYSDNLFSIREKLCLTLESVSTCQAPLDLT